LRAGESVAAHEARRELTATPTNNANNTVSVLNFERPLADTINAKPRQRLRDGEKAYLDTLASQRDVPPYGIAIIDLLREAGNYSKCLAIAGFNGACGGGLDMQRRRLGVMDNVMGEISAMMPRYSGSALKRVRSVYAQLELERRFFGRVLDRLEQFRHDAGAVMKEQHEHVMLLKGEKRRHVEGIRHYIVPEAVVQTIKRATVAVMTLGFVGEVGEAWANMGKAFWLHQGLEAAIGLTIGTAFGIWALNSYKAAKREQVERRYSAKEARLCSTCVENRRELMYGLALDLVREFRRAYPHDEERQMGELAEYVQQESGIQLALGQMNGQKIFAPDDIMAEKLAGALVEDRH
jgi:hypothetical protein